MTGRPGAFRESHMTAALDDLDRDRLGASPLPHVGFGDEGVIRVEAGQARRLLPFRVELGPPGYAILDLTGREFPDPLGADPGAPLPCRAPLQ